MIKEHDESLKIMCSSGTLKRFSHKKLFSVFPLTSCHSLLTMTG
ncbi:hypothetical protein X975_18804, partial [Stegodyphus mimosarum]